MNIQNLNYYEVIILHMLVGNRLAEVDNIVADGDKYKNVPNPEATRMADENYRNDLSVLFNKIETTINAVKDEEV